MAEYPSNAALVIDLAPLDPDGVQEYEADWGSTSNTDPWLASGETITESDWVVPAVLGVGDGSTPVVTKAGSVTPATPSIESSGKVARIWLYKSTATEGQRYVIENTIRTSSGRVDSRSFALTVKSK